MQQPHAMTIRVARSLIGCKRCGRSLLTLSPHLVIGGPRPAHYHSLYLSILVSPLAHIERVPERYGASHGRQPASRRRLS